MPSTTAQVSLNAASSGNGATVDFATAKSIVTAVLIPSGTITMGVAVIEASQDSTNWVPLATIDLLRSANRSVDFRGPVFRYWRASLPTPMVGGGSVTVTFMEAG